MVDINNIEKRLEQEIFLIERLVVNIANTYLLEDALDTIKELRKRLSLFESKQNEVIKNKFNKILEKLDIELKNDSKEQIKNTLYSLIDKY